LADFTALTAAAVAALDEADFEAFDEAGDFLARVSATQSLHGIGWMPALNARDRQSV
jgi:hypothetical protein